VLRVVRESADPVTAGDIRDALAAAKVELDARTWDRLQRRLRADDHVAVDPGHRYRYVAQPVVPSAIDAFERIVNAAAGRVGPAVIDTVRSALASGPGDVEAMARGRQTEIDGLRALAELASEIEELTVNEASGRALIHRIRGRVKLAGLEPIERAGETIPFDRRRHESIGAPVRDGAPVLVIRPGYAWRTPTEDVLISRAAVQE
jgi:hypothetical protein